jgi:hypothetical protein
MRQPSHEPAGPRPSLAMVVNKNSEHVGPTCCNITDASKMLPTPRTQVHGLFIHCMKCGACNATVCLNSGGT